MTPEQIAKSGTEHAEQSALFCWASYARNFGFKVADDTEAYRDLKTFLDKRTMAEQAPVPELQWLHAIPNAGARGKGAQVLCRTPVLVARRQIGPPHAAEVPNAQPRGRLRARRRNSGGSRAIAPRAGPQGAAAGRCR